MNLSEAIDQGVVNSTRVDATQNLAEHPDAKFSVSLSIRDICCSFDMIMYVYVNDSMESLVNQRGLFILVYFPTGYEEVHRQNTLSFESS